MITIDHIKESLRQAKELLAQETNEEVKFKLQALIEVGYKVLSLCESLDITEFTGKKSEIAEKAIETIQNIYNKHASN